MTSQRLLLPVYREFPWAYRRHQVNYLKVRLSSQVTLSRPVWMLRESIYTCGLPRIALSNLGSSIFSTHTYSTFRPKSCIFSLPACVDTRWFKYDRDKLSLVYTQSVPVIFKPPCIYLWCTNPLFQELKACGLLKRATFYRQNATILVLQNEVYQKACLLQLWQKNKVILNALLRSLDC
jgi:hypothetical protein